MKFTSLLFTSLVASHEYMQPLKVVVHSGYGTSSHAKPLLEIGSLLRARNHTVVYASFDGYEQFNKPYQFRFASLGSFKNQRAKTKKNLGRREEQDHLKHFLDNVGIMLIDAYAAVYPALSKVIEEENPDIIACDFFSPACRDVAEMKGIPLITGFQSTDMLGIAPSSFITSSLNYGSITTDNLSFFHRFQDKIFVPIKRAYYGREFMKRMNQIRAKHNVPPSSLPFGDFSTSLAIANTFEGLEAATPPAQHQNDRPHQIRFLPLTDTRTNQISRCPPQNSIHCLWYRCLACRLGH
ncbi:hypothetical protein DSO57_1028079 [Entomophthora muscae]|uniref:Uncharacterized protein n=1 Tax=Entomophthora muscae TaxID=34485 RepID=A0ACC2RSI6_9FUNG|nr:hypothetical protein DSO57_1028079 [Entomophthora muscae]